MIRAAEAAPGAAAAAVLHGRVPAGRLDVRPGPPQAGAAAPARSRRPAPVRPRTTRGIVAADADAPAQRTAAGRARHRRRRRGWRTSTGTASSRTSRTSGYGSRTLAFALDGRFTGREQRPGLQIDTDFYVAMNAWQRAAAVPHPAVADAPPLAPARGHGAASPQDFLPEGEGTAIADGTQLLVAPYGMIVLISEVS